ncbi:MAG TPA: guanylate kinase [Candidatus Dormibacteraeota bacterium]
MPEQRGLLFVISGPSGVGKDALVTELLQRDTRLRYSVSYTTRPRRDYEINGVHYNFVSRETFERMVAEGAFLEWADYNGNLYGTSLAFVEETPRMGLDVILKIEVKGAETVRQRRPDGIFIFIAPPSLEELARRRAARADGEGQETLERRQEIAREEMAEAERYDRVVVNDQLETTVKELQRIIRAERAKRLRVSNAN